jgi:IS5 family transposase
MDRCHLKGSQGDALHVLLCAAGYNIRWLLRMIVKKGLGLLLRLLQAVGLMVFWQKLAVVIDQNQPKGPTQCSALA